MCDMSDLPTCCMPTAVIPAHLLHAEFQTQLIGGGDPSCICKVLFKDIITSLTWLPDTILSFCPLLPCPSPPIFSHLTCVHWSGTYIKRGVFYVLLF